MTIDREYLDDLIDRFGPNLEKVAEIPISSPDLGEILDFEAIRTENGQVWRWEHQNEPETA